MVSKSATITLSRQHVTQAKEIGVVDVPPDSDTNIASLYTTLSSNHPAIGYVALYVGSACNSSHSLCGFVKRACPSSVSST